jgi:LCP family protein required for cell wall assembly
MKKGKLNLELMLGPGLAGMIIFIGIGASLLYRQPLGPVLETTSPGAPANTEMAEAASVPLAAKLTEATPEPSATEQPGRIASTKAPAAVCNENAVWNILILGSDAADLYGTPGSDLTRVLRVDFLKKTVSIFSLSRDLWVDASDLKLVNPAIKSTKLGRVFYEARQRSTDTDPQDKMQDGVNAMVKTLAANFDLSFDHYIAMDLDRLPAMIDTVGGVPIDVPNSVIDPTSGMIFHAGQQTLDGKQTAIFASAYLDSDLNRIKRNDLLLEALRLKMLDPKIFFKVPRLFIQFRDAINTDLTLEQINHLVCLLKEVEADSIIQEGVLEEWTNPGPEGSLLWDEMKVLGRLEELGMIP